MFENNNHSIERLRVHWYGLCTRNNKTIACGEECWSKTFDRIVDRYTESHRVYHGIDHIVEGLDLINQHENQLDQPDIVRLAYIGHDIIYWPMYAGNESASATYACEQYQKMGFGNRVCDPVSDMINATREHVIPGYYDCSENDMRFILSVDLYQLGLPKDQFIESGEALRREFALSESQWNTGRARWATDFLVAHENIYLHELFSEYEEQARSNLEWATAQ